MLSLQLEGKVNKMNVWEIQRKLEENKRLTKEEKTWLAEALRVYVVGAYNSDKRVVELKRELQIASHGKLGN